MPVIEGSFPCRLLFKGDYMKQQNIPKKNHYSFYDDSKPTHERYAEAIKKASGNCWWIEQYLRGVYYARRTD